MANQNIPGVSFHVKDDGRLVPVVSGPITDTVLIVGNAVDGPVNTPVKVNSRNVEQVFGPVVYDSLYASARGDIDLGRYNGNNLVKAYSEVVLGGCTNIILMRIGDDGTKVKQAVPTWATYASTNGIETFTAAATGSDTLGSLLGIDLKAVFPGSVYNGLGIKLTFTVSGSSVTGATLEIRQDLRRKGRKLVYTLVDATTKLSKRDLIQKINNDMRNQSIIASSQATDTNLDAQVPLKTSPTGTTTAYFCLSGGTDGVRSDFGADALAQQQGVYQALMGSAAAVTSGEPDEDSPFARLESIEADVVYLAALYADENVGTAGAPMTIAVPFAKALHNAALNDYPMVGVMGTKPTIDSVPAKVSTIVDKLNTARSSLANDALADTNGIMLKMGWFVGDDPATKVNAFDAIDPDYNEKLDLGRYVLMVAGPDVVLSSPRLGQYVETGAGVYAGLLSTVPPDRAVTNMILSGVNQLAFSFTNKQLNKLSGGQPWDPNNKISGSGGSYVIFRRNLDGNVIVNLDNTCAGRDSDYASYQVFSIVNRVASGLKRVVAPFIGMSAHTTTKTAMENQIRAFLDHIASTRAIAGGEGVGYDFSVTASGTDQLLGRVNIELTLHPAMQIKAINITISVAPPTGA